MKSYHLKSEYASFASFFRYFWAYFRNIKKNFYQKKILHEDFIVWSNFNSIHVLFLLNFFRPGLCVRIQCVRIELNASLVNSSTENHNALNANVIRRFSNTHTRTCTIRWNFSSSFSTSTLTKTTTRTMQVWNRIYFFTSSDPKNKIKLFKKFSQDEITNLVRANKELQTALNQLKEHVNKKIKLNAFGMVDLTQLFKTLFW